MPEKKPAQSNDIAACIRDIRAGRLIIVVDDAGRENEGDLVMAAAKATPRTINFMATHARGLICAPLDVSVSRGLGLDTMVSENRESFGTAFTVSVDAAEGITTGISASDRARTLRLLADPQTKPADLVRPGHIFPLNAKPGGVLQRAGHTEAAVDLARLAGLPPAGVICEILAPNGKMARMPALRKFARTHKLRICTVRELIEHRAREDRLVELISTRNIDTPHGTAELREYASTIDNRTHFALLFGKIKTSSTVRVRVHREAPAEDLFTNDALNRGMQQIAHSPGGVFLYMRTENMHADIPHEAGTESLASLREYGLGAQILRHIGLKKIALLTRRPVRPIGLEAWGLTIVSQKALDAEK